MWTSHLGLKIAFYIIEKIYSFVLLQNQNFIHKYSFFPFIVSFHSHFMYTVSLSNYHRMDICTDLALPWLLFPLFSLHPSFFCSSSFSPFSLFPFYFHFFGGVVFRSYHFVDTFIFLFKKIKMRTNSQTIWGCGCHRGFFVNEGKKLMIYLCYINLAFIQSFVHSFSRIAFVHLWEER